MVSLANDIGLGIILQWGTSSLLFIFSVREFTFTFAICRRPSVCRLSSVTFVHPTQAIEIFGNVLLHLVHLYSALSWSHLKGAQAWHAFSRDFTVLPAHPAYVDPQTKWTIPAFAFPAEAGTHLPTPEGWKAELAEDDWWVESRPADHLGSAATKNTSTRRWGTSPNARLLTWLCTPLVVTSSICSNSVHLKVCLLISPPTNQWCEQDRIVRPRPFFQDITHPSSSLYHLFPLPTLRDTSVLSRLRTATRFARPVSRTKNIAPLLITP